MHIIYLLQFLCGKLAHCLISLRIEMQPVVRILSLQTLRVFRIAGQLIEIDDLVEGTTFLIHSFTVCRIASCQKEYQPFPLVGVMVPPYTLIPFALAFAISTL